MRITIEPTEKVTSNDPEAIGYRVVIEHPCDGLSIEHAAALVRAALVAWGYDEATVNEYLPKQ